MSEVYDKEQKKFVPVDNPQEVLEGLRSGRYAVQKGTRVNVVDETTGELGNIPAEEAPSAIGNGFRFATAGEVSDFKREQSKSLHGAVTAGIVGLAEGATGPLVDIVAEETGFTDAVEHFKETYPTAHTAGELTAFALPLLPGKAIRAVTPFSSGIIKAGQKADDIARLSLDKIGSLGVREGVEKSLLRRAGEKAAGAVIPPAAAGGVEMALYQTGENVGDVITENDDLNTQRLIANTGMAFLYGAGFGGAFGTAGLALAGAAAGARKVTEPVRASITKKLQHALSPEGLEEIAAKHAFYATGAKLPEVKNAIRNQGGVENVGRALTKHGVVTPTSDAVQIGERLHELVPRIGREIGDIVRSVDEVAPHAAPDFARVKSRLDPFIKRLEGGLTGSSKRLASSLDQELRPFIEKFRAPARPKVDLKMAEGLSRLEREAMERRVLELEGTPVPEAQKLTLEELWNFRKEIDDKAYRGSSAVNPNPLHQELQGVRRVLEHEVERGMHRAKAVLPEGKGLERYLELKKDYGALNLAREAVRNQVARGEARPGFTLSDFMLSSAGIAAIGGFNPITLAAGFALGAANKFIREHQHQLISAGANKGAQLMAARQSAREVEKRTNDGIRNWIGGGKKAVKAAKRGAEIGLHEKPERPRRIRPAVTPLGGKDYEQKVAEVIRLQTNPQEAIARVEQRLSGLASASPALGSKVAFTAAKATAFLYSKIPPGSFRRDPLSGELLKGRVADIEKRRYGRYHRAVEDPESFVHDLEEGKATREAREAVETVYPDYYASIKQRTLHELSERKEKLSYDERLSVGLVLGSVTHGTMEPAFINRIQQMFKARRGQAEEEEATTHGQPEAMPAPNLASNMQTQLGRITQMGV